MPPLRLQLTKVSTKKFPLETLLVISFGLIAVAIEETLANGTLLKTGFEFDFIAHFTDLRVFMLCVLTLVGLSWLVAMVIVIALQLLQVNEMEPKQVVCERFLLSLLSFICALLFGY